EATLMIAVYVFYIYAVMKWKKWLPYKDDAEEVEQPVTIGKVKKYKFLRMIVKPFDFLMKITYPKLKYHWAVFAISIIWISLLSWLLVESAIHVSHILDIPEAIIALTVLAIGTSVPDLISSYLVAKDGKGGMAVSNAIGSNIFDVLIGLGLPWLIAITLFGRNIEVAKDNLVISVMLLFSSVIIVFMLIAISKWKIHKISGGILIGIYLAYLVWQVLSI
ncbi:MAG TPA: hypothetical protein VJ939_09605, partial [Bacteroidales bacterium]|nr:hypothetical protein [Bacteroidales bacterium]